MNYYSVLVAMVFV